MNLLHVTIVVLLLHSSSFLNAFPRPSALHDWNISKRQSINDDSISRGFPMAEDGGRQGSFVARPGEHYDDEDEDAEDEEAEYHGEGHPRYGEFQIHGAKPHHRVGMRPQRFEHHSEDEYDMPRAQPSMAQYGIQPDQLQHVQDLQDIQRMQQGGMMDDAFGEQMIPPGNGLYGGLSRRQQEAFSNTNQEKFMQ